MKFAEEKNAIFHTVSAYTGAGINELFENIGIECLNLTENENRKSNIKLNKKKFINYKHKYKCHYCSIFI